jgi:hypothetical protein
MEVEVVYDLNEFLIALGIAEVKSLQFGDGEGCQPPCCR